VDKLSKETCLDIATYARGVIKEALKNNTMLPTSVYEAPEMADMRIDRVVAAIVNYAMNKAEEESGCVYCVKYEHGESDGEVECTCKNHCGAMVCPALPDIEVFAKCPHEPYGGTPRCAVITCENYAGRHNVR
jgi:hypothetical protein